MNALLSTPGVQASRAAWFEAAANLGAVIHPAGFGIGDVSFTFSGSWLRAVKSRPAGDPDRLGPDPEQPGLWKEDFRTGTIIFDLPLDGFDGLDHGDDAAGQLPADCLAWMLATARQRIPEGWMAAERSEIESWLAKFGLTAETNGLVRQGDLVYQPNRLAIRSPIASFDPVVLPEPRQQWLRSLAREAQNRWRMARLTAVTDESTTHLAAEADLTGVPSAAAELLILTGLTSVRGLVGQLVEVASLLAHPAIVAELFATPPVQPTQTQGTK